MLRRFDKILVFLEKYALRILMVLILSFLLVVMNFFPNWINLKGFMSYFLEKKESTFINIAAIFIGVYFALLTVFSSVKRGSILSKLPEEDIRKLIRYLRNAMAGGFIYIFLTLFFAKENESLFWSYFNILLFLSLIYMLFSAIRFGVYMVFVVHDDISKMLENQQEITESEYRQQELMNKLEHFLEDYEQISKEERTNMIRQLLHERNVSHKHNE